MTMYPTENTALNDLSFLFLTLKQTKLVKSNKGEFFLLSIAYQTELTQNGLTINFPIV